MSQLVKFQFSSGNSKKIICRRTNLTDERLCEFDAGKILEGITKEEY